MNADSSVLIHYLQPITPLLEPADVTELVINRPGEVGVESARGWRWHDTPELTPAWLGTPPPGPPRSFPAANCGQ